MEILIYLGLVALIMPLVAALLFWSVDIQARGQDMNMVTTEGNRAAGIILEAIKSANGINQPDFGETGTVLSLSMADSGKNPTVFRINGGAITIQESTGPETAITSVQVTASGLSFSNRSQADSPGSVRVEFILSTANFVKTIHVTGSLRQ